MPLSFEFVNLFEFDWHEDKLSARAILEREDGGRVQGQQQRHHSSRLKVTQHSIYWYSRLEVCIERDDGGSH